MLWLYDVPDWLLAVLVVTVALALSAGGFIATRPLRTRASNDVGGAVLGTVGLIQGVLLALVAVAAWNNYTAAEDAAEREAGAIEDLFRHIQGFPDQPRLQLEARLRSYVELLIEDEWPALQRGEASTRTVQARDALSRELVAFDPRNLREQTLYSLTTSDLEALLEARRSRLVAAQLGLPGPLWAVALLGSALTIACTYFFRMKDERTLFLITSVITVSLALLIYLILVLDHPIWGTQGLRPDAFVELSSFITGS